jgi:diguanylate cyclase (GGDEF)-like protein/PAS domain S-box-containing protein
MNSTSIRLGLLPPLSGLVEIYGPEIVRAAQIAVAEVNEAGGVLGRPLELLIEDDGSLPQTAVPAAHRLVDAGCVAIIGNLLSNSRIAVAEQVADPRCVPYLNFSFYEGSIAARHFFHFAALPNQQIDLMIPWMAREYGPKMFFAGNNYEWPRGSIDAAKRALLAAGGDVVDEEYLSIGCSADEIETLLERVGNAGVDVFVPYFAGADQIALLTRFSELGLKKRMAVVMGHYDEVMVSRLPAHVREGFYSSNTYFMSVDTPENRAMLDRLARYPGVSGLWPQGDGALSNFGEGTYVCVKAFAAAAEVASRATGSLAAAELLPALERVSIQAPQGRVTMDPATHHAHVNGYLARCRADGGFDIVERFGCLPPEIPARYQRPGTQRPGAPVPHISSVTEQTATRIAADTAAAMMQVGTAQQILTVADVAVIATNAEGVIVEASPQAAEMFGYAQGEMTGMPVQLLLPPHLRTAHAAHMTGFLAGEARSRRMRERGDVIGYRKDGSFFAIEASIAKVQTGTDWLLVATLQDVTERKRVEEALVWKATHDALTGLPNRALIRERLANALQRSRRQSESVGLLFIDLDGFKAVNDSHGHEQGDALLKQVAERMANEVRPGDTVGRLAGDEFIVLCEQIEEAVALSTLAERINDALRQPVMLPNGREVAVAASIGVAVGHGSTHGPDDLLRNADTAMYAVKGRGRDGWQFFSENLEAEARQRVVIINGLRKALENNEFSIRLQPIVAIDGRRVVGAETLLRWHAPHGDISPAVFIPVAESTGTIVAIGAWVFREACRVAAGWRAQFGNDAPYLSFNVSTRQLDTEDLVETFSAILADTGANPADLVIEVTETALMANVEASLHTLRRLADLGMRVAVDDFGTGYSSFSQLLRLPVSVLKIDRAFVDGIDTRDEIRIVASAIVRLAHTLGHKVVAEGIETEAQLTELQAIGCDSGQGYLFDRPLEEAPMLARITAESLVVSTVGRLPIFYIIYVSEASISVDASALAAIKQQSVANNRQVAVTGLLIHQGGCFMQMLEGDEQRVRWLMEKIRRDPRHGKVRTVVEGASNRRCFTRWSMGIRDLAELESRPEFAALPKSRGLLALAEDPRLCYDYFKAFADRS